VSRTPAAGAVEAIGVVVPARNEAERIGACLDSVLTARGHPAVRALSCPVVVVLDTCHDGTGAVAGSRLSPRDGEVLHVRARSAAAARHVGVLTVLRHLSSVDPARVWVATTDADSVVPGHWLATQLALAASGADGVAGGIVVDGWHEHASRVRDSYLALLRSRRRPGGRHTHAYGANLGVRGSAYLAVGGFRDRVGEDRALRDALREGGFDVRHPSRLVVRTSGRRSGRAAGGLADLLHRLEQRDPA